MRYKAPIALAGALLLFGCSGGGDDPATPSPIAPPGASPAPPVQAPLAPARTVTAVFVLGDSLSDVGNAAGMADYLLSQSIVPPTVGLCNPADVFVVPRDCEDLLYRKTRVSDGKVAVEYLAEHFDLPELAPSFHTLPSRPSAGTNYAVASAKARGPNVEDLTHQVDRLLLDHAPLPADALFVVLIGGNDGIDAVQAAATAGQGADASAAIVASAVAAIGANVERLLDFGARRIVVANVPDLASLPAIRAGVGAGANSAALLARASAISEDFDRAIRALVARVGSDARWSAPTPRVIGRFDLSAAVHAAQQVTAAAGGNGDDACFDSAAYWQSSSAQRLFDAGCAPETGGEPRFFRFVFWDGIHPTGAAHAAIGAALILTVDSALANP